MYEIIIFGVGFFALIGLVVTAVYQHVNEKAQEDLIKRQEKLIKGIRLTDEKRKFIEKVLISSPDDDTISELLSRNPTKDK